MVIVCLIVMGLVWACRFVWRRSRLAGLMLAAGLAIRAGVGASFLSISYFGWPVLTSLQMGNGFWTLASDAQEYYRLGGLVAQEWQITITRGYTLPLGLWMRATGVNPASPVLFALVMYALAVVILVAAFGRNRTRAAEQALHLGIAALSFSPMLVYAAVFGLKDVFFTTLVVIIAVAYLTVLVGAGWTRTTRTTNLLAAAIGIVAVSLIAGTRAYFAILLWAAIGATYAGCFIVGIPSRRRALAQAVVVLPVLAVAIWFGAEGNYPRFASNLIAAVPEAVVEQKTPIASGGLKELDRRREAIDRYGGNSMLSRPAETARVEGSRRTKTADPEVSRTETAVAEPNRPAQKAAAAALPAETHRASRLEGIALGLGALLLPSVVLAKVAGIDLHISTTAQVIADADTLVFDLMAAMILWVVIVNRREISWPALMFGLVLALVVALPLAYVMTNFGTLIRLRLLVAAPIWVLTLALAPGLAASRAPGQAPRPDPAPIQ